MCEMSVNKHKVLYIESWTFGTLHLICCLYVLVQPCQILLFVWYHILFVYLKMCLLLCLSHSVVFWKLSLSQCICSWYVCVCSFFFLSFFFFNFFSLDTTRTAVYIICISLLFTCSTLTMSIVVWCLCLSIVRLKHSHLQNTVGL